MTFKPNPTYKTSFWVDINRGIVSPTVTVNQIYLTLLLKQIFLGGIIDLQ